MKKFVPNRNQEIFNYLLNIKYLSIYSDKDVNFIKNMNLDTDFGISEVRNVYDEFADVRNLLQKNWGEIDTVKLFLNYYMISLLNEGGIDISKTDVFKGDEDIYIKLDFVSRRDCKKALTKWDNLDPVDFICIYSPLNSIFGVKKIKDNKVKIFYKKGNNEPKRFIKFNDNAYKSFYDFYKFSGFPKKRIDDYRLVSIIKGAKDKNDLLSGIAEFNSSLDIPFKIKFVGNNIIENISKVFSR